MDLFSPPDEQPATSWAPATMTLESWLNTGLQLGFCSDIVCVNHDGLPMTDDEELEAFLDSYQDPCMHGVRIWP